MRKNVIVSGGTRGIGRAIIQAFANDGLDIITCSRKEKELSELKNEIESQFKVKVHTHACDLSKKEQVRQFVQFCLSIEGDLEVLVNNTGVFIPGQIHNEGDGVLESQIETNLYSAYHLTRGLIGKMMDRKRGYVFNICSTASITAYPNGGSYCISKFALYGMTKVLREEMKPHNIRVSAILPGATLTSSWEGVDLPRERFIPSEDIGKLVLTAYKLSDSAVVEDLLVRPQLGDIS